MRFNFPNTIKYPAKSGFTCLLTLVQRKSTRFNGSSMPVTYLSAVDNVCLVLTTMEGRNRRKRADKAGYAPMLAPLFFYFYQGTSWPTPQNFGNAMTQFKNMLKIMSETVKINFYDLYNMSKYGKSIRIPESFKPCTGKRQ